VTRRIHKNFLPGRAEFNNRLGHGASRGRNLLPGPFSGRVLLQGDRLRQSSAHGSAAVRSRVFGADEAAPGHGRLPASSFSSDNALKVLSFLQAAFR
jgi:hypothetical protein